MNTYIILLVFSINIHGTHYTHEAYEIPTRYYSIQDCRRSGLQLVRSFDRLDNVSKTLFFCTKRYML